MTGYDPRPDQGVDDRLRAWLVGTDLSTEETETGLDRVLHEFPVTPQVKRGFLGRWLDRDEGVERIELEPVASSSARRRASLLLSASAVATALAFIWLAVVIIETDRMAPDPRVADLVVAADGSGDFASITAAVDAARDGDTIRVQPGTYIESVLVDKDITLAGSDQREDVVIVAPEDGPVHRIVDGPSEPFALALVGTDAKISGLTLTGERSAVIVDGGQPSLQNLHFIDVTQPFEGAANTDLNSLVIAGGSRASVSDSVFEHSGPLGVYASDPSVIGNVFLGGSHIWGRFGDEAVIADNHIDGALSMGVWVLESGPMLIEHNTITGEATGIDVGSKGDSAARIRNNHITDADTGITVRVGDGVEISGNELVDTAIGVKVARFNGRVDGNEISGGDAGIVVVSGGAPRIADNVIDVSGRGIVAGAMTSPLISGNDVCGGETGIHVSDGATPQLTENLVCPDDAVKR